MKSNSKSSPAKPQTTNQFLIPFLLCGILISLNGICQLGGVAVQQHNTQLRALLNGLQAPISPSKEANVFYDLSVHLSDEIWWEANCPDVNTIHNWSVLYEEIWMSHYDTNQMTRIDTFWQSSQGYGGDTIPIGILDYSFHQLKDYALDCDSFFISDTNGLLLDNFKFKYNGGANGNPNDVNQWGIDYSFEPQPFYQNIDSSSPYISSNIFSMGLFKNKSHFNEVTYVIDPALISIGTYQFPGYTADFSLRIDFGEGNGYVTVDHTQKQYFTINYGTGGNKIVTTAFFDANGNQLKSSRAEIKVAENQKTLPSKTINVPGLKVGVYDACQDANDPNFREKFVIFLSGIDPLEDTEVETIYEGLVESGLAELQNHGYSIVVVDWNNSTIGLEINAQYVIGLINYMKCNYLNGGDLDEQFVLIGHSMGGVIGRYALRRMELMPNSPSACRQDLHHNTRLFVSYDAPHAGAYVPIAGQHFIANHGILGAMFTYSFITTQSLQMKYLYSDATQQMLLMHTNNLYTQIGSMPHNTITSFTGAPAFISGSSNYNPSLKRTQFMAALELMGNKGYPKYCKKMALSNGLLSGDKQLNRSDTVFFNPGDGYLNGAGDIKYTILGVEKSLISFNLDLNSLDATGVGLVYRHEMGMKRWKIVFKWKTIIRPFKVRVFGTTYTVGHTVQIPDGFDLVFDYIISKGREEYSNGATPYDNGPGGFFPMTEELDGFTRSPISVGFSLSGNNVNGDPPCYPEQEDPWVIPEFEIFSGKYEMGWCSKVDRYNFIPTYSALDYGYRLSNRVEYDHNILADDIATKMSNTPFDVIMGLAPEPDFPVIHKHYSRNRNHGNNIINFELFDPQYTLMNGRPMYLLNREIGEDTLFLSNSVFDRNVQFSTFDYLEVGTAYNPFYEYDGNTNQFRFEIYDKFYDDATHTENHIYSKKQGVDILSGFNAQMYFPAPANQKYNGSTGVNGSISLNPGAQQLPCSDPAFNKYIEWKIDKDEDVTAPSFTYYPNPVSNYLNIELSINDDFYTDCSLKQGNCNKNVEFLLFDLTGSVLYKSMYLITSNKTDIQMELKSLNLSSGTYILKGILDNRVNHFKIIVE
ncbi:MAG: T9SS type A sorting domain-containing protein [Salibacteraceae bacterium]